MTASTIFPSPTPIDPRRAGATPARLDREWRALCDDPAVSARLLRSPLAGHVSLASVLAASGGDRTADPLAADRTLAELVARAGDGDRLAARVVLQRILGALVSISARRTRSHPAERDQLLDDLVATAWEVITSFPIDRRPLRVAGNLCRDVEYRCCTGHTRRLAYSTTAPLAAARGVIVEACGRLHPHAADELADTVRDLGLRGLDEAERRLLVALVRGEPLDEVAEALGCAPRTVRWRRERLVATLRELAAA